MEKFIFVSDFDGTISKRDFYGIIINEYIGEEGKKYFLDWKENNKIDIPFLNKIFSWREFEEKEADIVLNKVEIDKHFSKFYSYIKENNGDFLILSAGFDYYIKHALRKVGLDEIQVITNTGVYENKVFIMKPDFSKSYFSPIYGIDKEKVILEQKQRYNKVYFAGDSEPDFKAAMASDVVFAKGELAGLLDKTEKEYYIFNDFHEIMLVMKEKYLL